MYDQYFRKMYLENIKMRSVKIMLLDTERLIEFRDGDFPNLQIIGFYPGYKMNW